MSFSDRRRDVGPWWAGERSGGKGWKVHNSMRGNWRRFCYQMPFMSPASAENINWTSSFLRPPTDSEGRDVAPFYTSSPTYKYPAL